MCTNRLVRTDVQPAVFTTSANENSVVDTRQLNDRRGF